MFTKKKISLSKAPFKIVKDNIFKTLVNAIKCKENDCNKDLVDYLMLWIERLEIIQTCKPSYLKCYYKELLVYELKLQRNMSYLLKHSTSDKFDANQMPKPTPMATDKQKIYDCLYPDWPQIMTQLKHIVTPNDTQWVITYMIACYYGSSKNLKQIEKYYLRILAQQQKITKQFKISSF